VLGGYLSPVHIGYGKKGLLDNEARVELCEKAAETSDWIMVDPWEALQPGHSTTLPVLESIQHRLAAHMELSLVCFN
jgi:nicotinamide mononucleotide adenylyltransferase